MNKLSKPKIGRMAWINYFASECKKKDVNGNSKSRSEIGKIWNLLPYEEKAKFQEPDVVEDIARNMPAEQPQQRDNDIPNNSDLPPTDEEIRSITNHPSHKDQTINTRCTPSRWCRIVKKLSEEQKQVVRALGFGNLLALNSGRLRLKICRWLVDNFDTKASALDIHGRRFAINSSVFSRVLGISNQGDQICLSGDVPNFDFWKSKFAITSRGIFLKDIEHSLKEMTTVDDEFKVIVCLFLLGTILCPSAIDYVQTGYLIPLGDAESIGTKNWSNWCFSALCEGIAKFQKNWQRLKTCCIYGCVLFLELFYFHSLQWDPPIVDKSLTPVICWTNVKIRKCVTRLHTEGGVGANQISVDDFFNQPAPAEGQYDDAAHGETSHANQQPSTGNNAHIKGMHDVLQVVKEIQATLKSELSDIRTKVNFLYEKYNSPGDKNSEQDLHNANSHQKSKHHSPPNPSPNSPPSPPSRPLFIPTLEHPIVEVSSNKTRTLPQPQQNISKSTPMSMNAPDSQMEDQRIDDLYHVPAVLTVPSLIDEDTLNDDNRKLESLSSNKQRIIQTRSTSKRKPSREVIVDLGNLRITRKSFKTLEPTKFLDSEIYIPINDLRNHWYLAVFDLINRDCQIWDSNPPRRKDDVTRLNQVRKLMQSLDIVLADDIVVAFPTSFSFTSFSLSYAEAPKQPNGYDCGLFICMFMDENCPTPVQMKTSECQRLFWARFLALFPGNTNLQTLKKNSQEHYNKLVSNNEVVPTVKMRPPPMKKLKGKAAALME
ncbi:hypothetical protein EZV62_011128 [Acer yangbiense]|uniref:Ubiquitin-like protease family profile domain-containing protein n=1 Tax=Acer yangbiense TaxID=1000413 RepID=A0A5C7I4W5_9ROSI|nr:hypothetical protein EZV62_011128 [Acer yangbiense]